MVVVILGLAGVLFALCGVAFVGVGVDVLLDPREHGSGVGILCILIGCLPFYVAHLFGRAALRIRRSGTVGQDQRRKSLRGVAMYVAALILGYSVLPIATELKAVIAIGALLVGVLLLTDLEPRRTPNRNP